MLMMLPLRLQTCEAPTTDTDDKLGESAASAANLKPPTYDADDAPAQALTATTNDADDAGSSLAKCEQAPTADADDAGSWPAYIEELEESPTDDTVLSPANDR